VADAGLASEARRVLITGATGQAGSGVVEAFLDAGWRVAGTTRRPPPSASESVEWIQADLGDAAGARAAVDAAVASLGGLDALVCLTGAGFDTTPIEELTWDDIVAQLSGGLRPTVEAVLAALSPLRESARGTIVTIGAQAAARPGARVAAWSVAKGGVLTFTLSLAAAGRPLGIRANCVLPGTLDTAANREARPDAKKDTWVAPRQLGELIVFLCSPSSAPLTGAAIPIG
jgi:NAD(P)-dependent dehydrogenase (short-subunit alcohol dehydrogenase family)